MAEVPVGMVILSGYAARADQSGQLGQVFHVRDEQRRIGGRLMFIQDGGNARRQQLAKAKAALFIAAPYLLFSRQHIDGVEKIAPLCPFQHHNLFIKVGRA